MNGHPQIIAPLRITGEVTIAMRQVGSLRVHPAWHDCGLDHLAFPAALNSHTADDPIHISTSGIVVKGFNQLKQFEPTAEISCFVYPWDDDEALQRIIEQSAPQGGLSDYARILLTIELLDAWLKGLAAENMRRGGQHGRGLSNLTDLKPVQRRREIARVAQVAEGYVSYAARIKCEAIPAVKKAVLAKEVPLYVAVQFLSAPCSQQESLAAFRASRTRSSEVRQSMRDLRRQRENKDGISADRLCKAIIRGVKEQNIDVRVGTMRTKGNVLLASNDLLDQLLRTGELFDGP